MREPVVYATSECVKTRVSLHVTYMYLYMALIYSVLVSKSISLDFKSSAKDLHSCQSPSKWLGLNVHVPDLHVLSLADLLWVPTCAFVILSPMLHLPEIGGFRCFMHPTDHHRIYWILSCKQFFHFSIGCWKSWSISLQEKEH